MESFEFGEDNIHFRTAFEFHGELIIETTSTVNFIKKLNFKEFSEKIKINYFNRTQIEPTVSISNACAGANEY